MIPDLPIAGVGRLLEKRASELRASASELLRNVWENLILVDRDAGRITIQTKLDGKYLHNSGPRLPIHGSRRNHYCSSCHKFDDSA